MPPTLFNTHGRATRAVTLMKRVPDPASVEPERRPPKEVVVIGKDAHRRVLDVLAKAFPQKSKETPMMTPLAQQADALEKKIEALEKQLSDEGFDGALDHIEETVAALEKIKVPAYDPDNMPYAELRPDSKIAEDDARAEADEEDTEGGKKAAKPHKFETMVANIAARDQVPKAAATTTARKEYPELFASYQSSGVAKSYAALVEDEIRKGCSPSVAAQRVAYAHPQAAREALAKSESGIVAFLDAVIEIRKRDGCGHVEAIRKARAEHPAEFARFQNV